MPNYSREKQAGYLCEYHGVVGSGSTPADALESLLGTLFARGGQATDDSLTDREKKLIDCLEWVVNVTHENHHRATTDSNRLTCPNRVCTYVNQILERVRV